MNVSATRERKRDKERSVLRAIMLDFHEFIFHFVRTGVCGLKFQSEITAGYLLGTIVLSTKYMMSTIYDIFFIYFFHFIYYYLIDFSFIHYISFVFIHIYFSRSSFT